MVCGTSLCDMDGCGGRTGSKQGLQQALPAELMALGQGRVCWEPGDVTSQFPLGKVEKNIFCSDDGNGEKPLSPWGGGASPHPDVARARRGRRRPVTVLGYRHRLHPVCVLVVAVLVALVLALAVAVAVLSAGRDGWDLAVPVAPVLACPDGWVGYRNVCYYLSREEGSWEWSQEQCSSRGASLAVLRREWEMGFLSRLKGDMDPWIGLRRRGERLEWVDGSSFNQTFEVHGEAECVYLFDHILGSTDCSQRRPYICSKPQVPR